MARSFLPSSSTSAALPEISDPSDFNPTSIPGLAALDASLRCEICKDFFTAPVITSCSHTFCSLCIRRCLGADGKCATCRAGEQESRLRRNAAVAGAVEAWQAVREGVLKAVRKLSEVEVVLVEDADSKGDGGASGGLGSKEEEVEEEIEDEVSTPRASQKSTRSRTSTRSSNRGGSRKTARRGGGDDDDYEDDDIQIISDSEPTSTPRRAPRRAAAPPPPPNDGLVPCPVCNHRMTEAQVQTHIDDCLSGKPFTPPAPLSAPASPRKPQTFNQRTLLSHTLPSSPSSSSSQPATDLTTLPKITYNLFTETSLRKKIFALGIPSHGPKKLLQERHTEWLNIWNANVDSPRPKTKRQLLAELDEWERAHSKPPNRAVPGPVGKGYAKDWDDKKHAEEYKGEFEELVRKAREGAKRRKVESEEAARKAAEEEGKERGEEVKEEEKGAENEDVVLVEQQQQREVEESGVRTIPQIPTVPSAPLPPPPQEPPISTYPPLPQASSHLPPLYTLPSSDAGSDPGHQTMHSSSRPVKRKFDAILGTPPLGEDSQMDVGMMRTGHHDGEDGER